MPFAMPLSGGSTPIARRLRSLFLAGAAMAIIPSLSHAQDAYLRGSVPEDVLSASSPDTLATRGLAAPGRSDSTATTSSDDGSDAFYAPTQDNAAAADSQQQAAPVARAQDQQALQPDTMRVGAITNEADSDSGRAQRENTRQAPEQGRGPAQEADPFAPVGMRAGSFVLRPSLEQGIRATSNGDNSPTGSSSVLSETTLRLNAQSDWARHQATLDASGTLSKSISGQDVSEPQIDIQGNLRLDLTDQTTVNTGAGYRLRRESASNPNGVVGALKRPLVHTLNGSLGVEHDTGLVFGRATARVEHDMYGDAEMASGGTVSQKDRDNTYASITLRGGFSMSQAIKPFAEVELGKRIFDERVDSNGYERSGSQFALRGGLMVDMGEKLNGEFAAGYMRATSDDDRLGAVSGPSINAALNWSPLRGTDVRLYSQTTVDMSTTPGIAGSLLQFASLDVTHRIRSDLSLNGRLDALVRANKDGTGTDYTLGAQIGATYWINRFVGIDTRLRHEFLTSQISEREYKSNSIYLGVKVQR
ncbi:outer membrane beta-barrel protein [Brucella haematophila]|uniref:outer membrane beta-barrel protein n=1 Tax=Brucella haematophila TaxID=419474 RepID=UPI00110E3323|nr:outer membrane beta-barrel protein [Brucella haematophila]TMV05967.1 hypothetical protein FGI60_01215 [Brucella haematophila]